MKAVKTLSLATAALAAAVVIGNPARAATGIQIGASGKTYASSGVQCAMNPVTGMAPFIQAGLYNPTQKTKGTISLNGTTRAHTPVFLSAGLNVIAAANGAVSTDYYVRDGGTGTCTLP